MDIQNLACFLTLCETLNYSETARACFISRQAVRQIIQRLEAVYGLPLIENRKNRLLLTAAGEVLRAHAQGVVADYAALERAMHACHTPSRPLRVGISRSLMPFYAPDIVARLDHFAAQFPGISLDLRALTADEIIAAVQHGEIDAGILVDMEPSALPLRRHVLARNALRILLARSNPLAAQDALQLRDLDGCTLDIMSEPSACFAPLVRQIEQSGATVACRVVTEYCDVLSDVRDNGAAALDRADQPPPSVAQYRLLPVQGSRLELCTTALTQDHPLPGIQMLIAFLAQRCEG